MARTATQYLRGLVNRQVKRMERRGYTISDDVKDLIKNAKYQTLKSLQRDRYRKLYEKSTATTDTGEEVSGTRRRIQERRESVRKAQETRRRNIEYKEQERDRRWEEERRRKDEEDRQRAWQVNEGELIYEKVINMYEKYPTNNAMKLREMLIREISKYGYNHVMMSLANAPAEAIAHAETIIYTISGKDTAQVIHAAFVDFANIIRGTKATTEEAKEMGDAMDEMTDFETFK